MPLSTSICMYFAVILLHPFTPNQPSIMALPSFFSSALQIMSNHRLSIKTMALSMKEHWTTVAVLFLISLSVILAYHSRHQNKRLADQSMRLAAMDKQMQNLNREIQALRYKDKHKPMQGAMDVAGKVVGEAVGEELANVVVDTILASACVIS
ncbi:hypothetical protein BJ742DRAFT_88033 [Cladochytrium replicatum]|nr:hypothetical protein BJ742DRAFT_88033 [Cladochytrium replicatum]